METRRGDEALALGALAAGVRVVTGYPGSPATGVFDALVRMTAPEQVHAHWAPNEKVALELAFGASLSGSRALVVIKSVGMNIALDPLATMALSGCHAGLVILLGDDPGGWGSQNEQDSRWAARVAEVPLVEVLRPDHAASLMVQAFAWSESLGTPVIVRLVRAFAQAAGPVEPPWQLPACRLRFLRKRNRWVVLPSLVLGRHRGLHRRLRQMQQLLEASPYDLAYGEGRTGVVAAGYTHTKLVQVLGEQMPPLRILGLASAWPLPEHSLVRWLQALSQVLVLEEGGPFVEEQLRDLAQRERVSVRIWGRHDGAVPEEGELTASDIAAALVRLGVVVPSEATEAQERSLVSEQPLCDDCPYRSTFDALLRAMERQGGRGHYIVVGEAGCMVRANLPPYELFDVKYSLGSSLGLAIGLALGDRRRRIVSLLGDSSFFHSDLNALPHAVQLDVPLALIVLDNHVTGFTGGQAHPGADSDERRTPRQAMDIAAISRSLGVAPQVCDANLPAELEAAIEAALAAEGRSMLVVRGACPRYAPDLDE